jgi:hypothetical protein
MAKAILGYVGGDIHLREDHARLRRRVQDLEALVMRLQAENDALQAELHHDDLLTVSEVDEVAAR